MSDHGSTQFKLLLPVLRVWEVEVVIFLSVAGPPTEQRPAEAPHANRQGKRVLGARVRRGRQRADQL